MTDIECRMYHEMLWGKMVERIKEFANGKKFISTIDTLKQQCVREITKDGSIPKPSMLFNCYLCEHYNCVECPLSGAGHACLIYHKFCRQMDNRKFKEAIKTAEQIRDIFGGDSI